MCEKTTSLSASQSEVMYPSKPWTHGHNHALHMVSSAPSPLWLPPSAASCWRRKARRSLHHRLEQLSDARLPAKQAKARQGSQGTARTQESDTPGSMQTHPSCSCTCTQASEHLATMQHSHQSRDFALLHARLEGQHVAIQQLGRPHAAYSRSLTSCWVISAL